MLLSKVIHQKYYYVFQQGETNHAVLHIFDVNIPGEYQCPYKILRIPNLKTY